MERRFLVTALALVFVLAAITPTLGAQSQTRSLLANSGSNRTLTVTPPP